MHDFTCPLFPPKTLNLCVIMRKSSDKSTWTHLLLNKGPVLLKTAKIIKNEVRETMKDLKSLRRNENKCNVMSGWDPGAEKWHWGKTTNLDKIWSLVNNNVPMLISCEKHAMLVSDVNHREN